MRSWASILSVVPVRARIFEEVEEVLDWPFLPALGGESGVASAAPRELVLAPFLPE